MQDLADGKEKGQKRKRIKNDTQLQKDAFLVLRMSRKPLP